MNASLTLFKDGTRHLVLTPEDDFERSILEVFRSSHEIQTCVSNVQTSPFDRSEEKVQEVRIVFTASK